jgi:response regulator RpfG family c-di-GMP phosphodiesterase
MKPDRNLSRRLAPDSPQFPSGLSLRLTQPPSSRDKGARLSLARPSSKAGLPGSRGSRAQDEASQPVLIYAVDDLTRLTELYGSILETKGYLVKTFNHRAIALASLYAETRPPALLITDYVGVSMPINRFILACHVIEPKLRILMASGFAQAQMRFSSARPDGFLEKPFTPAEFVQAIETTLSGE